MPRVATKRPEDLIVNAGNGDPTILIYDDIGPEYWGLIGSKTIAAALDAIGPVPALTVRINSMGGSVFEGTAIYNLLKAHPAQVTTAIDGAALSIASLIALAGDTVRMAENGYFMIHDPLVITFGNEAEHAKSIELLKTVKESLVGSYAARVDAGDAQIAQWMADETWFTAAQALEHGFIDEISANKNGGGGETTAAAAKSVYAWRNPPADWTARQQATGSPSPPAAAWRANLAARRLTLDAV